MPEGEPGFGVEYGSSGGGPADVYPRDCNIAFTRQIEGRDLQEIDELEWSELRARTIGEDGTLVALACRTRECPVVCVVETREAIKVEETSRPGNCVDLRQKLIQHNANVEAHDQ